VDASRITVPEAIDERAARSLATALAAAGEAEAKVVVLQGRPGLFCRGLDFDALGAAGADIVEEAARAIAMSGGVEWFARCLEAIRSSEKPTVAVVDGTALGGGLAIAAACDVLVASDRSTFGLPEVLFGLAPAIAMPVLLERMPAQKARSLALSGRSMSGEEAHACGLVDMLSSEEDLEAIVRRVVRELARPRTASAAAIKELVRGLAGDPAADGIRSGVLRTTETLARPEVRAATAAFERGELPWEDE
jgi:enoyl-CoA hydratase/carnithine racemase